MIKRINNNPRCVRISILVCYTALLVVLAFYHTCTYDELQAWMIAVSGSPIEIYKAMALEGHFCLWHFLLYPFAKLGLSSAVGLPLVSITLMVVAAWWLLRKSPFGTLSNVLILAWMPMCYYFPIVSRCYALIPLLLWITAYYYQRRREHPLVYGLCLGLLINTHLYIEGLTIYLMIQWAWEIYKGRSQNQKQRNSLWGWLIAFGLGIFAVSQIVGTFFIKSSPAMVKLQTFSQLVNYLFSMQAYPIYYLSHWATGGNSIAMTIIGVVSLLSLFVLFAWATKYNKSAIFMVAFACVYQFIFAMYGYYCLWHRAYLPLLIMLFSLWICNAPKKRVCLFAAVLVALNIWLMYSWSRGDITGPKSKYTQTREVVSKADRNHLLLPSQSYMMQIIYHCYGTDTIAATRYSNIDEAHDIIQQQNPDSLFIIVAEHYNKIDNVGQKLDSIANSLGYEDTIIFRTNLNEVSVRQYRLQRLTENAKP